MDKNKILRKIFKVFNPINAVLPKNKNTIVFYSNLGFRDNVKALYDYCIEHSYNKKYKIVCVCPDYEKFSKNLKPNVKFVGNKHGILYFLRSKYFFYSFGKYPIKPAKNQIVINLWHGTPLKTIGMFNNNEEHLEQNFFTYVLAASPYFVPVMAKSFGVKEDKVFLCGHARNDKMFSRKKGLDDKFHFSSFSKTIFWLPTYKKMNARRADTEYHTTETALPVFETWSDLSSLNDFLSENNILLLIKLHPLQEWNDGKTENNYSNIQFFSQKRFEKENLDLYEMLAYTDALITDYSSVYFDYLLKNKPIGFTITDLDAYKDTRGFVFDDPLNYMPGEKILNREDFVKFITDCKDGIDDYADDRNRVNDLCNYYKDDRNSKRILDFVGIDDE